MKSGSSISEFCIYEQETVVKVCRLLTERDNQAVTSGFNSGRSINKLKYVKIITVDNSKPELEPKESNDDFSLYVEGEYNKNNSRFYNYCRYDDVKEIDLRLTNRIYSIGSDGIVYVYMYDIIKNVEGFIDINNIEGRANYSNITNFGTVTNYFKFITNNIASFYSITEYYINNLYQIFSRTTIYQVKYGLTQMLTSNPLPDTPADFNKLGIKGNNIFDDQLSLNKSVFMHDGLLVNAKIKTGATEYDNILIGGVDYTTGSIFQIKDDNNVMIARCEVTNVYAGMMKKFKIVEAGTETSKIKLGITKAHGGGVGAYISITDSMLDNRKNSILYESDVIVYSDADNKGDGNITMISGILSNKQININPSVGAQICSKIVRTFEPYNNMNKLFYLIGNKVYSQQPLAGPKAVSNLNLTVEESYELQEIKCIIMGFTPSSGGEDKNKDKTIVKQEV